ncbi:MAG TPA: SDR family oxidoreductase [Pseudomonadales bacterium]|jgi:NAD(P)-dependent dehydrogenase (short-subunit alcohol dehydrogenase family)|nr:SDR family oxidoreductase [Pseudomonadales bacterium]HJP50269.1 SDR family oxidoreductase [Pseudomonadales bacterium]|tara:strand:- start:26737 stop:27495 length:759 start_codon:yes stop_codon:yes gene_type:complete
MSSFELTDKVAIITGGAGGIGSRIARAFKEAGAKVVIASRNQENLDKLAAELNSSGGDALAVATDVCDPEQVENLVKQTIAKYGRIDILVNNAGGGAGGKAEDLTLELWNSQIALNLTSVVICTMAVIKGMIAQESGKIINISSVAGVRKSPGLAPYAAAKAAVISLTKNWAPSWVQHNINVNCVAPGLTATEGIKKWVGLPPDKDEDGNPLPPLTLHPDPEDVADLVLFLASPASDRITGETMLIRHFLEL